MSTSSTGPRNVTARWASVALVAAALAVQAVVAQGPCSAPAAALILQGNYGPASSPALRSGPSGADVTSALRALVVPTTLAFIPSSQSLNAIFGDPLPGVVKELHVTYTSSVTVSERRGGVGAGGGVGLWGGGGGVGGPVGADLVVVVVAVV